MASDNELTRLADMAAALRPDWNPRSVRAVLGRHRDRAYADLAVVLAVLCTDPRTATPGRIDEHGPWWIATRANTAQDLVPEVGPGRGQPRCQRVGHEHEHAAACRLCRAEQLTQTPASDPAPAVPAPAHWRPRRVS